MAAARSIKPGWNPQALLTWRPKKDKPEKKHLWAVCKERNPALKENQLRDKQAMVDWLALNGPPSDADRSGETSVFVMEINHDGKFFLCLGACAPRLRSPRVAFRALYQSQHSHVSHVYLPAVHHFHLLCVAGADGQRVVPSPKKSEDEEYNSTDDKMPRQDSSDDSSDEGTDEDGDSAGSGSDGNAPRRVGKVARAAGAAANLAKKRRASSMSEAAASPASSSTPPSFPPWTRPITSSRITTQLISSSES